MSETPDLPTPAAAGAPEAAPRPAAGRRALFLVALIVILALISTYFLFFQQRKVSPAGAPGEEAARPRTSLVIFPFAPAAGSEAAAWIGDSVPILLSLSLEDQADLRVLTPERRHDLSSQIGGDTPAPELEVARRGETEFLLRGTVTGSAGEARLKAEWVRVASGQTEKAWELSGVGEATLGARLDELASHVREQLGLGERDPDEPRLAGLVPIKEAPLRSYVEGSDLLARGDAAGALTRLTDAVAVTDFHLAQFSQAVAAAQSGDRLTALSATQRLRDVSRALPVRVTLLAPALAALYAGGNPREAVGPLESFLARFPEEKHPLAWLGAIELLLLHEPDRALEHLDQSRKLDPSARDNLRLIGQARLEAGEPDKAATELQEFLKGAPEDDATRLILIRALRQAGQPERAREETAGILNRHPENLAAVEQLGNIALDQDRAGEALEIYQGPEKSPNPRLRAAGLMLSSRVLLLEGRFNDALRRLQSAVDLGADAGDPDIRAQHLLSLGQVQASLGRTGEALSTLSKIRGLESKSEPDLPMITVLVLQKQYDSARRMMDEQVRRWQDRASPELLARLKDSLEGNIALEEGKFPEAAKKILGSLPAESRKAPTSESLGRAYLGAGDYANAEALFTRIVQSPDRYRDPVGYLRAVAWLGEACDKQGKREAALGRYQEILKWWGKADFSLPEIEKAREGVKRLGR